MPARKKRTSKKHPDSLRSDGGMITGTPVADLAVSPEDVTDRDSGDLGDYIKHLVQLGHTCKVYPEGDRIMLSLHG